MLLKAPSPGKLTGSVRFRRCSKNPPPPNLLPCNVNCMSFKYCFVDDYRVSNFNMIIYNKIKIKIKCLFIVKRMQVSYKIWLKI